MRIISSRLAAKRNLINRKLTGKTKLNPLLSKNNIGKKRDTYKISNAAAELANRKTGSVGGNSINTKIDKSINLNSYITRVKEYNEKAIFNAGDRIDKNAVELKNTIDAMREALTDKYTKLLKTAKSYRNPSEYIELKYFGKGSVYYENDLTEAERRAGYNAEISMLKKGTVGGVDFQDSLFRGMNFDGDIIDNEILKNERCVIDYQIKSIMKKAGINVADFGSNYELAVDPYSYQISVAGADAEIISKMENALNNGDNGKNLWKHINKCATKNAAYNTQASKEAYNKHQAYARVKEYTGLSLNELTEKNGTYYTESGENILDVLDKGIAKSVPYDYRKQVREWVRSLVFEVAGKGWNNIPDMKLSIAYGKDGLKDLM